MFEDIGLGAARPSWLFATIKDAKRMGILASGQRLLQRHEAMLVGKGHQCLRGTGLHILRPLRGANQICQRLIARVWWAWRVKIDPIAVEVDILVRHPAE